MRVSALALSLVVVLPGASFAAWPNDPLQNVPVCTANAYQGPPYLVTDGSGGAILIWADKRNAPSGQNNFFSIYAQRVDDNAFSRWAVEGSPVLASINDVALDAACSDGSGGAYVAWLRNSITGGTICMQHISANGVPSWGANGLDIGASAVTGLGTGLAVVVVPDGATGVLAVWRSREGADSYGIRAQHLDANGTSGWGASGVLVRSAGPVVPQTPLAVADGQGGVLASWVQSGSGATGWEIRSQHVGSSGAIAMDPLGLVLASGPNMYRLASATDGAHGAVVAWSVRESASLSCVRAQRVAPDGQMLWPLPGLLLGTNTFTTPNYILACPSLTGDVIVAWKQADLSEVPTRIQAQRVDPTGTPQWPDGGVTVSRPTVVDLFSIVMCSDGSGGAILAYEDQAGSPPEGIYEYDLAAARVTGEGDAPWGPYGVTISNAHGPQEFPEITADGTGGAIIGWRDERWGAPQAPDVYAQNIHADGTMGGGIAGVGPDATLSWARVWPQPSRSHVDLAFSSPGGFAGVTILDPQGRRVRELLRTTVPAGETRLRWDGLDDSGAPARAGLYFVAIASAGRETVRKIVLER
jgi:hypothetical protein